MMQSNFPILIDATSKLCINTQNCSQTKPHYFITTSSSFIIHQASPLSIEKKISSEWAAQEKLAKCILHLDNLQDKMYIIIDPLSLMIVHFATSMKEVSITNKCKIAILSHFFILPRDIQNLASKIKQQNFVDSPFKDNTRAINTI